MSIETQNITTKSDLFWRCPFCKEALYELPAPQPSLKQQIREHANKCQRYADWIAKVSKEREEESALQYEGPQQARFCLHFILKADLDIARLKANLNDPEIDDGEKQHKIARELAVAEGLRKTELKELYRLCNKEENEVIRNGANEEVERALKMPLKERRRAYDAY